MIEEFELLGE